MSLGTALAVLLSLVMSCAGGEGDQGASGGSAGGSRHMDLIVLWDDGEVTLYQGGDSNDAARPFAGEYQLAPRKSIWTHAVSITGVNATGGGTDGLVVRWSDGEMTQYTTVDAKGFHGEKQLAPRNTPAWRNDARLLVAGRFTPGGHRDDLLVEWKDGHVSVFADLAANGLSKQTQIVAKNTTTWPYAEELTTGSFTGKSSDDLLVRWVDGETTIYPGLTGKALPGEIRIRVRNSEWKDAAVVAAGAFNANTAANDVIDSLVEKMRHAVDHTTLPELPHYGPNGKEMTEKMLEISHARLRAF